MKTHLILALGMGLAGVCCGDKTPGKSGGSKSSTPSRSTATRKLKASVNGKPVRYVAAYVYTHPWLSEVHVRLLTRPLACEKFAKWENVGKGVYFIITPKLRKDGTRAWTLNTVDREKNQISNVVVDTKRGGVTRFDLRFDTKEPRVSGGEEHIRITGTVVAKGCGVVPEPSTGKEKKPQPRPQKLKLTIAGKPIPIRGARLRHGVHGKPEVYLVLSTTPLDCRTIDRADVSLNFQLTPEGKLTLVNVHGHVLTSFREYSGDGLKSWKLVLDNLKGTGPVTGTLSAKTDVYGRKVAVLGAFSAIRCPKGQ